MLTVGCSFVSDGTEHVAFKEHVTSKWGTADTETVIADAKTAGAGISWACLEGAINAFTADISQSVRPIQKEPRAVALCLMLRPATTCVMLCCRCLIVLERPLTPRLASG